MIYPTLDCWTNYFGQTGSVAGEGLEEYYSVDNWACAAKCNTVERCNSYMWGIPFEGDTTHCIILKEYAPSFDRPRVNYIFCTRSKF